MADHPADRGAHAGGAWASEVASRGRRLRDRSLARRGIEPSLPLAYLVIFVEVIGGLCIALGLFTRFFAAAAAIRLLVVTFVHWPQGFGWANRGYEYPLFWGLILFAIALRGGGPYSLDRRIGKEL